MPNNFVLPKSYISALDEVYKMSSVTADLTTDDALVRAGANVGEVLYPHIEVSGLGNYSRNSGYTDGSANLEWETAKCNYDRGTRIQVDTADNQESFNLAFGALGAALQRERVAPEADAFTFSCIYNTSGISIESETFANGAEFLESLLAAKSKMDEDEVPEEGRILYATPTLLNSVMALDTTKSREVLDAFAVKKKVPQSRFYTAIDLLDGKTPGEELGHYRQAVELYVQTTDTAVDESKTYYSKSGDTYTKVTSPQTAALGSYYEKAKDAGKKLNYMIIHKPAIIKYDKHIASDVIPPNLNSHADAYLSKYRKYGLVDVYKNKVAGVYASYQG